MDVNAKDRDGWTPLLAAAKSGHAAIEETLLEAKADIHAMRNAGETKTDNLFKKMHTNEKEVAKFLKQEGAGL